MSQLHFLFWSTPQNWQIWGEGELTDKIQVTALQLLRLWGEFSGKSWVHSTLRWSDGIPDLDICPAVCLSFWALLPLKLSQHNRKQKYILQKCVLYSPFFFFLDNLCASKAVRSSLALHSNIVSLVNGQVVLKDEETGLGVAEEPVFKQALSILLCGSYRNQLLNIFVRPALVALALQMTLSSRKGKLTLLQIWNPVPRFTSIMSNCWDCSLLLDPKLLSMVGLGESLSFGMTVKNKFVRANSSVQWGPDGSYMKRP